MSDKYLSILTLTLETYYPPRYVTITDKTLTQGQAPGLPASYLNLPDPNPRGKPLVNMISVV